MKFKLLGPAVAAAALVGTTLTGGIAVAQTPSAPLAAAAAPSCGNGLTNVPAKETVKVRKTAKLNGTAVGQWNKGKKGFVCNDGKSITGQKYTLCGKTSTEWLYGITNDTNVKGYVPRACIKW
ncbi:hypothetical protein [Streptomyces sp. NPDC047525]|uniref:hypothetical protein n=1 Tax=Streptomyces sp. NPDC047525 TaxID=3155264 RepID=UPI00341116FE